MAWGSEDTQPPSRAAVSCLQGSAGASLEGGTYFLVPLWSMVVWFFRDGVGLLSCGRCYWHLVWGWGSGGRMVNFLKV